MNIVQKFIINNNKLIEILVPDLKDKFTYYYEPTEKLHMFDEVTIIFKEEDKIVVLYKDNLNVTLFDLKNSLENTLNSKNRLSESINVGELGKYYNINTANQNSIKFNFSIFWVWSTRGIQTWLYNKNNKIYLEISPSYPWLYSEPKENDKYITFDDFMKNYKPIAVEEINKSTAQQWINQCNEVINKMIKV